MLAHGGTCSDLRRSSSISTAIFALFTYFLPVSMYTTVYRSMNHEAFLMNHAPTDALYAQQQLPFSELEQSWNNDVAFNDRFFRSYIYQDRDPFQVMVMSEPPEVTDKFLNPNYSSEA
jgi:hypothetical protein